MRHSVRSGYRIFLRRKRPSCDSSNIEIRDSRLPRFAVSSALACVLEVRSGRDEYRKFGRASSTEHRDEVCLLANSRFFGLGLAEPRMSLLRTNFFRTKSRFGSQSRMNRLTFNNKGACSRLLSHYNFADAIHAYFRTRATMGMLCRIGMAQLCTIQVFFRPLCKS